MALKRPGGAAADNRGSGPAGGGDAANLYPSLWEYLSLDSYDDGTSRETSTMLVFVEEGSVKLCLNDREAKRKAWVTGRTPEAAIAALEAALSTGAVEWRADGAGKRPGRK